MSRAGDQREGQVEKVDRTDLEVQASRSSGNSVDLGSIRAGLVGSGDRLVISDEYRCMGGSESEWFVL